MDDWYVAFLRDGSNRDRDHGLVRARRAVLAAACHQSCGVCPADLYPSVVLQMKPFSSEHGEVGDKCNPENV